MVPLHLDILKNLVGTPVAGHPFAHRLVKDFFSADAFAAISTAPEVLLPPQTSDEALIDSLLEVGYEIITFPGCTTDPNAYVQWHREKIKNDYRGTWVSSSCEGFGLVFRLKQAKSQVVQDVLGFLYSRELIHALADLYELPLDRIHYDAGLQKYLDGYEISPHPDIRRKALTFMVNLNPNPQADQVEHHTHLLRFHPNYSYVGEYWKGNSQADRCWVPWDWCKTESEHRCNNSMMLFQPANDTLHGVHARYDHLTYQRTQLYGNFWHVDYPSIPQPWWENFVIPARTDK